MAENKSSPPDALIDSIDTMESGMNSGLDPLLLQKNQLSFASNTTIRDGFARTRPPVTKRLTITYPSTEVQSAIEQGLWQGAGYYNPDQGDQSLFASISGRLFQFLIVGDVVTVTERTIPGDPNPATSTQAWIWQAENYLIVQDGISLPLFFDGTTTRRSGGPSVLLAVATTSTSPAALAVPPIGSQVVLTLSGNWPDVYDTPVLFNGEYYQPIANSGGYVVNLTSLYSTGGAINVNDAVNIVPGYVGVVVSTSAFTVGAAFTYPATVTVQMTAPYTGPFNPTFAGPAGKVILFGKVWAATSAAGNNVTFTAGEPGVFSALPAGTIIQYVTAPSPNVLVGFNTILAADPGTGGTVQLTLSQAYTGAAGQVVYIGANQYTIAAVVPAAGVASVTMINLTDPTATYNFASPKDIISVPELPAGRMGCYGLGQNWMALIDGLSFICSDQSRGPSGTPANSYRDAVLKTTDLSFRGGNFAIPGAGNVITSMIFTANLDTALGQGSLEVGTAQFMGSVQAPFDFENPNDESPLLTYSLIDRGPLGQASTLRVNSDVYFRSTYGVGSLVLARRDFESPGNTPISEEMVRVLNLDDEKLLTYGSAIVFDNRFLMTCSPQASSQGVIHAGLVVQNLDPVSGARNKLPPVWDGLWTGVNTLQLVGGLFAGAPRAFSFSFNVPESKIELYEFLKTASTEVFDNGVVPITWAIETAALFRDDIKPRRQMISLRDGDFSVADVIGPVRFQVYYRSDQSCWVPWHSFGICASTDGAPQYFPRLSLGEPSSSVCDPNINEPLRNGYTFQFRFVITGQCRLVHARFMAVPIPTPRFQAPLCEQIGTCQTRDCEAITGVAPFSDLEIYNLQDALEFNGTPIGVIQECPEGYYCPPGTFPRTVTYPPGTFDVYIPPINTGFPIVVQQQGCESLVTRTLAATATLAQVQAAGQEIIQELAEQQARCDALDVPGVTRRATPINLSAITEYACVGVPFSATILATSTDDPPFTFSSEDLPAWMTAQTNAAGTEVLLTGTPPAIASATFTITATSPITAMGSRTYTLNVVGIVNTSPLPDAVFNSAYTETLTAPSIPGVLTWSVIAGALPAWMDLNSSTGVLFGTPHKPDVGIIDNFTIQVTNGSVTCSKEFDIETIPGPCGDLWLGMDPWAAPAIGGLGGVGSATSDGGVATFSAISGSAQTCNITLQSGHAPFVYPPALVCSVESNLSLLGGTFASVHIQVYRISDGIRLLNKTYTQADGPGVYTDAIPMGTLSDDIAINIAIITGTATPGQDGQAAGVITFGV